MYFFSLLEWNKNEINDKNKTNKIDEISDANTINNENNNNDYIEDDNSSYVRSIQSKELSETELDEYIDNEKIKNDGPNSNKISEIANEFDNSNTNLSNNRTLKFCNKSMNHDELRNQPENSSKNYSIKRKRKDKEKTNFCKIEDLFVERSRGRKADDKTNFCIYCKTMQTKIARHFELRHGNEEKVKKFLILPKNSQEQRTLIGNLRKKRNYEFNTNFDLNDGTMIVIRRPNNETKQNGFHFLPCPSHVKDTIRETILDITFACVLRKKIHLEIYYN